MMGAGGWGRALPLLLALCGLLVVGPRSGASGAGALFPDPGAAAAPHAQDIAGREPDLHDPLGAPGLRSAGTGSTGRALPVPAAAPFVAAHTCCPPPLLSRLAVPPEPAVAALPSSSSPSRAPPFSAGT